MGGWVLRVRVLLCLTFVFVVGGAGAAAAALGAQSGIGANEAPGIREAIKRDMLQAPGPLIASQGADGGSGEAAAPAGGELEPSLATAYSDTWKVPRRSLVTRIYAAPVNYKASDGSWHAISDQLVPAALGGYENQANSFQLRMPMSLSSGVSLTAGGQSASFALVEGKEAMPAVSSTRATYSEALTATDFAYESISTGVKETATLKNSLAPKQLRFQLSVSSGLTVGKAANGDVEVLDASHEALFHVPAPVAYRPGEDPGRGKPLPISVSQNAEGWVLAVDTSAGWLRSELAAGPVAVDPGLEVGGSQNCWIESDALKTSYCSQTSFDVGYQSTEPAHEHHGLLQFNLSSLPADSNVLNAKLGLYLQSKSTTNAKPVGVYRVTKPWTTAATWETYDGTHPWTTPGGDYSNPTERSDAAVNPSVGATTGWYYWYPTKMVQEWANTANAPEGEIEGKKEIQGANNEGLIVKDETDNTINNVLSFASIRATEHLPFLQISYEARGVGRDPRFTILNTALSDKITAGVNVGSGNLSLTNQDLAIAGRGVNYSSTRTFNGLDPDVHDYGRFNDSNFRELGEFGDGSIEFVDASDAHYVFIKQASGSYITPPGIKATFCKAGHSPCPTTLPSGVAGRLIYNQSQSHIDFSSKGWSAYQSDRHENKLTAGTTEGVGAITSWTDTQGRKVTYKANSEGFYTEISDETGGRHLKYSYEGTGGNTKLLSYTDAAGNTTKYEYQYGDLVKVTTPAGHVTKFNYYSNHQIHYVTQTTNSDHTTGPTTEYKYYEVGAAPSPCEAKQKATVVTDPDGVEEREKAKVEGKAHQTLYCINVLDEVEKVINANGQETKASFDPFGNTLTETAAARETGGSAGYTSSVYGIGGQNLECQVSGTKAAEKECPKRALTSGYASELKYEEEKNYEQMFQPTKSISPRQKVTTLCYWGGEKTCEGGGEGAAGELKTLTSPLSTQNQSHFTYNAQGLPTSSTDPDGHETKYEYDSNGNLKAIIAPSASGLGKETTTVDAISRPHTVTQCLEESGGTCVKSQTATLTYDALDRLTEAVYTGPGTTKTFKYTYDTDGNLEKQETPDGTTKYSYDPANRLTEEELPGASHISYTYDPTANLLSVTDSGGTTNYIYDALNEMVAMSDPGGKCGESPSKCTEASYDNDGSLTKVKYPSGATINYGLDPTTGRVFSITAKGPAPEEKALLSHTYTYIHKEGTEEVDTPLIYKDILSQPGTATDTTTYEYDPLNRLLEATTTGTHPSHYKYVLDGAGNRTSQQVNTSGSEGGTETFFRYNTGNELECRMKTSAACSKSATSEISGYSYDGAGNETSITGYSDPASTSFTYNNLNQLKTLTPPGLSEQTLTYLGMPQASMVGVGENSLEQTSLGVLSQEIGTATSRYGRTPSGALIDERLPSGTTYNPITDTNGDLIGLLSGTGTLAQTVRYGPYGENAQAEAKGAEYSPTNDPFLFQGGYHMPGGNAGTGGIPNNLYHFGERYYDPTTGQWTQPDQAGGGFGFDGGNPVNSSDPNGECPFNKDLKGEIFFSGGYTYVQVCGTTGHIAGKRIATIKKPTSAPSPCLVKFFNYTTSTCQQVKERWEYEVKQDNKQAKEYYEIISCLAKLNKGSGTC